MATTINPFALVQQQIAQAVTAAQEAAKTAAKSKQATSSSSSTRQTSSSSGRTASQSQTSSWYTPMGSNTDEEIRNKDPQSWYIIQLAKDDYARAQAAGDTAGMARAHQTAEQIRSQFGYSGGEDGSLYVPQQTYEPVIPQVSTLPTWDTSSWGASSSAGVSKAQEQAQELYEAALAELERARQEQQQALQAEIDRTLLALNAQIPGIERSAADANAGAYETWLRATNPFGAAAQRQSQLGLLNSGYSESNLASLGNTYQSVVGSNEQAKTDWLRQIDLAREEAKLTGGIEKANQMAEFAKLMAQQRFDQGSALLDAAIQGGELGLSQQELMYEMEQDERNQLETLAALLARYGIFDGYRALGVSDEQVAAMEAYWRALQVKQ